ncbi:hypothetical protein INS90_09790 [Trueperella pecoris]|uniref:Uncharacterized protein n=1 Tax=Trueperella pecoris TaxID=2733571 RepID=A0A7M1R065_9ACTO|nr:hypothetical protein [Trueperella pecoris]QOR47523.1 hypothetical protein INS90_09790 [Trueperella pecoris]
MRIIRILAALSAVTWLIAAVRVWDDAHNPYTTGLCVVLTIISATITIHPKLVTGEDENNEVAR